MFAKSTLPPFFFITSAANFADRVFNESILSDAEKTRKRNGSGRLCAKIGLFIFSVYDKVREFRGQMPDLFYFYILNPLAEANRKRIGA